MKKLFLIFLCVILFCGCAKPITKHFELKQIIVGGATEGNFFLLGGHTRTDYYFTFYTKDKNGQILLRHVYYGKVKIYEDSKEAYVIYEYNYPKRKYYDYWEVHVPPNSICHKVDLELK